MMKIRYLIGLLAIIAIAFAGCKTAKKTVEPIEEPVKAVEQQIRDTYIPWTDVEMPVRFELRSPKKMSISGTAKMVSGEAIYVSLRFFGIEMGNIWITSDSVQAVVKAMNVYYKSDISSITAKTGITLNDMQEMLLGHMFNVPKSDLWTATFTPAMTGEGTYFLQTTAIEGHTIPKVVASYEQPAVTPCGPVAPEVMFNTEAAGHKLDFSIRWTSDRARWNSGLSLKAPKVPSGAQRLTSAQIIKILEKL